MMSKKQKNNAGIPMDVYERAAPVLRMISHPHRLKIVELLEQEKLTVGELAERIGLAPHACSQHLRMMQAHKILSSRREGKTVYYEVISPHALDLICCIRTHGACSD
ncbi:winged helix-turn-helix transcriptional regulator [Candidatus Sumerlaeota bacterium]|nr:winged helix-turn-helix transcriptional regulator [Candidatus Sumerlaeota bacterium]